MNPTSALEIAAAVNGGGLSAEALIRDVLRRIAEADPALNAFTAVLADRAIEDARALDASVKAGRPAGPLAGAPFAVKNLFDIAGVTTLAGSKIRRDAAPATQDAVLVARLKAAGAILVGALNMDEFAYGFVTENAHYGATRNPHDLSRIAGGSSGGSAAVVAAGLTPLSLGSDTNGSIRVPASLCGVYGLKPTLGRLSCEGVFPFVESLDHAGLFARTLDDLMLAYQVLAGPGAADDDAALQEPPRVGVLGGWFTEGAFPEVLESLGRVGEALGGVFGVELPGAATARSAAYCLSAYEGARLHAAELRDRPLDFDPAVRDRLLAGALLPDEVARLAQHYRMVFRDAVRRVFDDHDVLVAPATPCPAPVVGQATMTINGEDISVRKNLGAYTQPLSYIGVPVLAAPVNRPGRLPIGVQIIAPAWRENLLFRTARALEDQGVVAAHRPRNFQ